jgi:predicted  nucleic acid-binding Zn-ribbon protein
MYVQKAIKEVLKSARSADKAVRSVLKRYDTPAEANETGEALAADNKAVSNQETDKATTKQGQEDTDAKTSARNKKADGVFAFNVVKSLFEDSSPLAVEAMKDAGQYLNDSIAAILMYTPEDANESPLNKELNKSDAKPNPSNKGETKPSKPSPYADVAKKGDS